MNNARRIALGAVTQAANNFGLRAAGFLAGIFFIRWIDKGTYNDYALVVAHTTMFGVVFDLGLDMVFLREFSRLETDERRGVLLWNALRIKSILLLCFIALSIGTAWYFDYSAEVFVAVAVFTVATAFSFYGIFQIPFRARLDLLELMAGLLVLGVCGHAARLAFGWHNAPLLWVIVSMSAFEAAKLVYVSRLFDKKSGVQLVRVYDPALTRALIVGSWPMMVIAVASQVHVYVDQLMINMLMSSSAGQTPVATYAAAVFVVSAVTVLPGALGGTLLPVLTRHFGNDEKKFRHIAERNFKATALILAPVVAFVLFYAPQIVHGLFGAKYDKFTTELIAPLLGGAFFQTLNGALFFIVLARNWQRSLVAIHMVSMSANVLLNSLLIPRYGLQGAAWATMASYSLTFVGGIAIEHLREYVARALRTAVVPTIVAMALFGASYWIDLPYALLWIPMLLYPACLFAVGYVDDEDKIIIKAILKKG